MKRRAYLISRKLISVILSASMVMTSVSLPAMASQDKETMPSWIKILRQGQRWT